ncbi:hypothetical protein GGR50DRAFT_390029 [Xylaria sp. CBS 124048]|nr:hypothetical protein GGR50DRAFT_390029 [Xylaria sp. CBS 124048]
MSVFLDFDSTITVEDTVSQLADFALRFHRRRDQDGHISTHDGPSTSSTSVLDGGQDRDLSSRWNDVVRAYMTDHQAHVSTYTPRPEDRQTVEAEIAFLHSLRPLEMKSLARIDACALFRSIGRDVLREAGRELVRDGSVRLRPGFTDFVRAALVKGWRVHVVSVNWSAAFIEGACGFAEGEVDVFANEVREGDGAVRGPSEELLNEGWDGRNITNSLDKRDVVRAVMRMRDLKGKPLLYFGDSTTDLECLLEASRGVVMADDEGSTLMKTLRRIGKRVPHARDADGNDDLIWVSNFEELMARSEIYLE